MIENRLFHLISTHRYGVPLELVASSVFQVKSGSMKHVEKIILPSILADKRFICTRDKKLVLSEQGERFKDLFETLFIALDIETTGSHSTKDKITEIAALKIQSGVIVESFETLINPGMYIPYNIIRLTGIANEMVHNAPTIQQVIPEFLDFIGGTVLIAHNASFDIRFINAELKSLGLKRLENRVLCTYRLGRRLFPDLKQYSLRKLSKFFGIVNASPHRAGSDAAACAHIFITMLNKLPEKGIFALHNLLDIS